MAQVVVAVACWAVAVLAGLGLLGGLPAVIPACIAAAFTAGAVTAVREGRRQQRDGSP